MGVDGEFGEEGRRADLGSQDTEQQDLLAALQEQISVADSKSETVTSTDDPDDEDWEDGAGAKEEDEDWDEGSASESNKPKEAKDVEEEKKRAQEEAPPIKKSETAEKQTDRHPSTTKVVIPIKMTETSKTIIESEPTFGPPGLVSRKKSVIQKVTIEFVKPEEIKQKKIIKLPANTQPPFLFNDPVLKMVFLFLNLSDIYKRVGLVCKNWQSIANNSPDFTRSVYIQNYGTKGSNKDPSFLKARIIENHQLEKATAVFFGILRHKPEEIASNMQMLVSLNSSVEKMIKRQKEEMLNK